MRRTIVAARATVTMGIAVVAAATLTVPGTAGTSHAASAAFANPAATFSHGGTLTERRNIRLVRRLYRDVFTRHKLERADRYIRSDYIQHTPGVPPGLDGFKQFYSGFFFKKFPDVTASIDQILAQNDRVVSYATWRGHDAQTGKALLLRTADIYRMEHGKIAEHWDVIDYTGLQPHGIEPPVDDQPSTPIDWAGSHKQRANLRFLSKVAKEVFMERQHDRAHLYVARDIKQHDPGINDGIEGFLECLQRDITWFPDLKITINHMLASDKMAVVFWTYDGHHYQTGKAVHLQSAELYRISDGKLAEHWNVTDYSDLGKVLPSGEQK